MKRALILGAGFSKAVAGLPVTKEMFSVFEKVRNEQKLLGNKNRVKWHNEIDVFINRLLYEFLIEPNSRADKNSTILSSNYFEDFEGICSFIDLNIAFEIQARSEKNGVKAHLSGKPKFFNDTTANLTMIRSYIGTYLFLSLINYNLKNELMEKLFSSLISETTAFISFNYDLVMDQFLFKKGLWNPRDGYGFTPRNLPQINPLHNTYSKILLLKLHGSLNWKKTLLTNGIELTWRYDDDRYFFPSYLLNEPPRLWKYQGGHNSGGFIFPSWIKTFNHEEMYSIWQKAFNILVDSDEIYFLGYSLPDADAAVFSLLNSVDFSQKVIVVIDPKANEYKKKYSAITKLKNVTFVEQNLENYLNNL
ncbi:MAG: hypothetical protein M1495_16675 [Bacteroidetes bacterium]|nr:hypothetical protein [Bacteroidota bacterium]MCL6098255.1 hypothetical protein [Bacteroidota bacterium]